MCFSATASFIAGGSLGVIGGLTVKQVKTKSELPFALVPLLFAVQQTIEGVIWLSFGTPVLNMVMTYAYIMFAHVLWPVYTPLAIMMLERNRSRRKVLHFFVAVGIFVAAYLLYYIFKEPVTSAIVNNSIAYTTLRFDAAPWVFFYLFAACVSCFVSTHRMVNYYGALLFVSFYVSYMVFNATFGSVWCFFAAVLSIMVYLYFRFRRSGAPE